jgi:hypothetical protein
MAEIFGNSATNMRGCFMVYTYNAGAGRGAQLVLPDGGNMPENAWSQPYIVTGFGGAQREAVTYTKTFGGRVYTFAFGHDPNGSHITVQFLGFLVSGNAIRAGGGGGFSSVTDIILGKYNTNRISQQPRYAKLTLGRSKPIRGFIVGMSTETGDAEINVQRFTVELGLPEVQ